MSYSRKAGLMAVAFFALTFVGALTARADSYSLTNNNFGQPGSIGSVTTLLQGNGTILVTVQLNPGFVLHNAGVGLNTAPGLVVTGITGINPADRFAADLTSRTFDSFGTFAYRVDSLQSTAQAVGTNTNFVSFVVSADGGFTSASQLTGFAMAVAPINGGAGGFAATGPATITPAAVPEPTTMLLLGTGLAGVAVRARRRRKGAAAGG